MRIATKEYNVYSIEDVKNNEDLKEKVLQNYVDINVDCGDWHLDIFEDTKEELRQIGFNDVKMYYSGFYSQGDGACFVSNSINLYEVAEYLQYSKREINIIKKLQFENEVESKITHNFHYYHSRSTNLEWHCYLCPKKYPRIVNIVDRLMEDIETLKIDLSDKLYKKLEKHYEYLTSGEAVLEALEDFEFTEDGKIY